MQHAAFRITRPSKIHVKYVFETVCTFQCSVEHGSRTQYIVSLVRCTSKEYANSVDDRLFCQREPLRAKNYCSLCRKQSETPMQHYLWILIYFLRNIETY